MVFVKRIEFQLTVLIANFRHFRLKRAVRQQKPVRTEIVVMYALAEVAAVAEIARSILGGLVNRLVDEVPDEPALQVAVGIKRRLIFIHVAQCVAHRVFIFALDVGRVVPRLGVGNHLLDRFVHAGIYVDARRKIVARLLVVPRARRIVGVQDVRLAHLIDIRLHQNRPQNLRVLALVAQRPHDDARMIAVTIHHVVLAVNNRVRHILCNARVFVNHVGMDFEIRLIDNVNAVFIAQIIPVRTVRVMRRAHGVDVVLLHDADVCLHDLARHGVPVFGVRLVAVDAAQGNRLPVDSDEVGVARAALKPAACIRLVGHFAETYLTAFVDRFLAARLRQHQRVEIRVFGAPLARGFDNAAQGDALRFACRKYRVRCIRRPCDRLPVRIVKLRRDGNLAVCIAAVFQHQRHRERAVREIRVKISHKAVITHERLRRCVEVHVAENAAQIEIILIFQP